MVKQSILNVIDFYRTIYSEMNFFGKCTFGVVITLAFPLIFFIELCTKK